MDSIAYYIFDGGELIAGFVSLCTATSFCEEHRFDSNVRMDIVDAHTGEVIDTWLYGEWEHGDY